MLCLRFGRNLMLCNFVAFHLSCFMFSLNSEAACVFFLIFGLLATVCYESYSAFAFCERGGLQAMHWRDRDGGTTTTAEGMRYSSEHPKRTNSPAASWWKEEESTVLQGGSGKGRARPPLLLQHHTASFIRVFCFSRQKVFLIL